MNLYPLILIFSIATISANSHSDSYSEGDSESEKTESEYSMNKNNGRFHQIHLEELSLSCSYCHGGDNYKKDYLNFSKHKDISKKILGRIKKTACLGCHQEGGPGSPWYGGSSDDDK